MIFIEKLEKKGNYNMREKVENFNRKELLENYHQNTNPFSFVTTRIEVTKLYQLCKKSKSTYATIGYYFTKALNKVDAFKYRYEDGTVYKYDVINPNFTQMFSDETIGYFTVEMQPTYEKFIDEYKIIEKKFLETHQSNTVNNQGEVWLSCEPWFHFSGCVVPFDKEITIPQIIWDQFDVIDDKCYLDVMIMSHHGFVDGFHIGKLINQIKEVVESIEV